MRLTVLLALVVALLGADGASGSATRVSVLQVMTCPVPPGDRLNDASFIQAWGHACEVLTTTGIWEWPLPSIGP